MTADPDRPNPVCPDDATVERLMAGTLDVEARSSLLEHAADCETCCDLFAALAPRDATSPHEGETTSDGQAITVDRYELLETLGSGGMGIVYCAYDAQLDRKVALKLLRDGSEGSSEAERLLREARSMAKLSHPNVVRVFDVGVSHGRVFVAMELVEDGTLRAWLAAKDRPWREILALFRQAGEGLAAAHRVGLVHRDFKPENLLVRDGTVLVTDFGLARAVDAAAAPSSSTHGPKLLAWDATNVAGTPVYMAPEQLTGEALDARADIFAFSVAAWEALYGGRPFSPDGPGGLLASIAEGPREPKRDPGVPEHVRRALTKGMAFRKKDRPRSMDELLAACEVEPARVAFPVRRAAFIAFGIAVLFGIGFGVRAVSSPALQPAGVSAPSVAPEGQPTFASSQPSGSVTAQASTVENDASISSLAPRVASSVGKDPSAQRAPVTAVTANSSAVDAGAPKPKAGSGSIYGRSTGLTLEPFGMGASPLLDMFRNGFADCFPHACVGSVKPGPRSGASFCRAHVDASGHVTGGSCKNYVGDAEVSCHAFERCVVGHVKSFALPKPSEGPGDVTMHFAFVEK